MAHDDIKTDYKTSPNFFARSLMISRTFVLNVFCSVDKVSLVMINCMRFVFVLISFCFCIDFGYVNERYF